jgi:hypothetical protein
MRISLLRTGGVLDFHLDAVLNFHVDTDLDLTIHFDADPEPAYTSPFSLMAPL